VNIIEQELTGEFRYGLS